MTMNSLAYYESRVLSKQFSFPLWLSARWTLVIRLLSNVSVLHPDVYVPGLLILHPACFITVYQTAKNAGLTTLVAAIDAAGYKSLLNDKTLKATVFAPTNEAFEGPFTEIIRQILSLFHHNFCIE